LIDPQLQANKWIKKAEKDNGLKVLKFSDQYYQIDLRAAITQGYTALIQDIEETLDPLLDPILAKQV
jgi:dynein heavy chain, axonemal